MVMKSARPSVLVIDSGIGGLSICRSILASGIDVEIRYLADNAAFPYGSKSESFLVSRLEAIIRACLDRFEVNMIVLACNTISTLVLPRLRSIFELPIVGVVPAIKPAASASKIKVIGLLATPGTVSRPYTQQLIDDFASDCKVVRVGSSVLVEQAEQYLLNGRLDEGAVLAELEAFQCMEQGPDTIVLGCTHFPFLQHVLEKAMPSVSWVDSGDAIARRVESLLDGLDSQKGEVNHKIFFTGSIPDSKNFKQRLEEIGLKTGVLEQIEI